MRRALCYISVVGASAWSTAPPAALRRSAPRRLRAARLMATNSAVVFIKPDASTDGVEKLVRTTLAAKGVTVGAASVLTAARIEEEKLIDAHYGYIAHVAMSMAPSSLSLSEEKKAQFEAFYGVSWAEAGERMVVNGVAMERLGCDAAKLEAMWRAGPTLKLAPATYISKLDGGEGMYTINGFYPAMRDQFVRPGAEIRLFQCSWDSAALPWAEFRESVVGATDPAEAAEGSLRKLIFDGWEGLGMAAPSRMAANGVHASAGPLEGLKERAVWAGAAVASDPTGKALLDAGLPAATLDAWLDNAVATLGGATDKVFDLTEAFDTDALLAAVKAEEGLCVGQAA